MRAKRATPKSLFLTTIAACAAAVILASTVPGSAPAAADPAPFKVGAAEASAAFEGKICLGGYGAFCNRPTTKTHDPLTTQAFAFTGRNNKTVLLVKGTAVGLFAAYKDTQGRNGIYDIRQRIAKTTGVPATNVVVTSDHSHAAPDTIGIWGGVSQSYMDILASSMVKAARDAYAARQPARIFVAGVQPSTPKLDSSYDAAPTDETALDEEFRTLFAETPSGDPIATVINYAPHATACGQCNNEASGDWTAWASQEVAERDLGVGAGFVGALGATDWGPTKSESEARGRINDLLDRSLAARHEVAGDTVDIDLVFVREQLMQPVLLANLAPNGVLKCPTDVNEGFAAACDGGEVRIDRSNEAPWFTGNQIGTYVSGFRIGDAFFATAPGEPFPQVMDAIRDSVSGASEVFLLGGAQDFLGYMVANEEQYQQTAQEGALFLPGCPEENVTNNEMFPVGAHDGACPDHWTLMVSPTMGEHVVCTATDVAGRLGFTTPAETERCMLLTALDGQQAPAEHPGAVALNGTSRAGVAVMDASWHLGASGGQFSDDGPPFTQDAVDPHGHSVKKASSKGLGSKTTVRALVVQDAAGDKVAIVSHDLYLPQDLLTRRIGQLVAAATDIAPDKIMVSASHNHNTPYYSTPGWGTAVFQDVIDLRFFDYMAKQAAAAVTKANATMVPVRMGGTTSTFNEITSHTYGPQVADDGTPAGQPYHHTTGELTVVAFDDMTNASAPKPLATWIVFGVHPEWTWGYDLINGDIGHATMRIVDREVGGVSVWTGREIGTSGPHKDTRVHAATKRREYQDNGFAQIDRAARKLATAVENSRTSIGTGNVEQPDRYAPFATTFDVDSKSQRFAPPNTRPYPGVSNCNTAALFHADPRVPITGLPDCENALRPNGEVPGDFKDGVYENGAPVIEPLAEAGGQIYEQMKAAGVPIPESYSGAKLTAVEETAAIHLMAIRLGDIGITVCPCEQFTDTALNIESRIDRKRDNLWLGWNWARQKTPSGRNWCVPNGDAWTCANPQNPNTDLAPVSDLLYQRMVAQIENDAEGWEDDLKTLGSEAEPADPAQIKGNFTHEEFSNEGYKLPISVGMGNDYWGYVPEYREYRSHDHYRKALSGVGPHGADFLATRLARLAASLNGGPDLVLRPLDEVYQAESARAEVLAQTLGEMGANYEDAYATSLPADGGRPAINSAPVDVELFSAAQLSWIGGSTYADMPDVRVQRLVGGTWVDHATTEGEIELMVKMPRPEQVPTWRAGDFAWQWFATFEAFGSDITLPNARGEKQKQTPIGTYRFVVDGQWHPAEATTEPYKLVGDPFKVVPWRGLTASDVKLHSNGASFKVGPGARSDAYPDDDALKIGTLDMPDSYTSPFTFIRNERRVKAGGQVYCSFCSFRPWADTSNVSQAVLTVQRHNGKRWTTFQVAALMVDGRWLAKFTPRKKDRIFVEAGGIVDTFGNVNGARSELVIR